MWNRLRSMWTIGDLRKKILYTVGLLLIFRIVAYVPVPGIDSAALASNLNNNKSLNQLFGLIDVFSGGSLSTFSIVSMGLYPYITASIVIQLLQPIIPKLDAMAREGEAGRNRLAQITRYITVPLALLQAFSQMALLVNAGLIPSSSFNLFDPNYSLSTAATLVTLTAGTMFLVWIGELITENGIGNGISLIIFANIMVRLPQTIGSALVSSGTASTTNSNNGGLLTVFAIAALALAMTFAMVFVYQAQRRVPVQYPTKRRFLSGVRSGQQTTYIPLMVNSAGMIPLIFASSILLLPTVIANFVAYSSSAGVKTLFTNIRLWLDASNWYYWLIFGVLVALFTFFYATVVWQQQNMADNLQKQGAFIPGIRPGLPTEIHLNKILLRITFGGALFLGIVAVAPALLGHGGDVNSQPVQAASLLIVVGVVLDTVKQLEAQMVMRNYSGFLR